MTSSLSWYKNIKPSIWLQVLIKRKPQLKSNHTLNTTFMLGWYVPINKQLEEYFHALLCKYQSGFWKSYGGCNWICANWYFQSSWLLRSFVFNCETSCPCGKYSLLHLYLAKQKQKVTLNGTIGPWKDSYYLTYFCVLFQFCSDLDHASYTDDKNPHPANKNLVS